MQQEIIVVNRKLHVFKQVLRIFGIIVPLSISAQVLDDKSDQEDELFELPPFMVEPTTGWYVEDTILGPV